MDSQRYYNNKLNRPRSAERMTTKSVIQNLEDSELIRIFLQFVQNFHLQYQKIDKEISYKCHEATWILATTKATGYGRTQSEAYKHALRNLLQILIEDPPYTQFFINILTPSYSNVYPGIQQPQGRQTQNLNNKQKPNYNNISSKQQPLYSNLSASLTSNSTVNNQPKRDFKTEVGDLELEDDEKIKYIESGQKLNTSISGANNSYNPYSNTKLQGSYKYETINKNNGTNMHSNIYSTSYKCINPTYNNGYSNEASRQLSKASSHNTMVESVAEQSYQISKNKSYNASVNKINIEMELKQALIKNKQLCEELSVINKQNQILKTQLSSIIHSSQNKSKPQQPFVTPLAPNRTQVNISNVCNSTANMTNTKGMRLSTGGSNHNTSSSYLQQSTHSKAYSHTNINLNGNNGNQTSGIPSLNNNASSFNPIELPSSIPSSCEFAPSEETDVINEQNFKPRQSLNGHQNASKCKVMVPKLKLQILPNYHKKAQKSLNDSLLAVYEQKYGVNNDMNIGILNANVSAQPSKKVM